ncbi:MAG TPA: hypothetical protein VNG51_01800 [Ktedonobacteraceae bacterium]|nr:hypothetical protein [Ktedonobacteraceae bacterium]
MAQKRCIPTDLFFTPGFAALSSDTVRLILIGLVTDADDAGRGLADEKLLGRKLDHRPEQISAALDELGQAGYVTCYAGGKDHCYALCHWQRWQTLSKPTPSHYPAPPAAHENARDTHDCPGEFREPLGNRGESGATPSEGEEEPEEEENRREEEAEAEPPSNVVTFPGTAHGDSTTNTVALSFREVKEVTTQVARILKLTVTEALTRVVADYAGDPALSLLGEADAAREYIENPRRNRHAQRMTPAFFRRWLKREHEETLRRRQSPSSPGQQATGTDGPAGLLSSGNAPPGGTPAITDPYQAFVARRVQETQGTLAAPKGAVHGTHQ